MKLSSDLSHCMRLLIIVQHMGKSYRSQRRRNFVGNPITYSAGWLDFYVRRQMEDHARDSLED